MKGTYLLVLYLKSKAIIDIGSLKKLKFPKGYYLYIGSAMGSKGSATLESRIKRHLKSSKKLFWHIDYFINHQNCIYHKIYLIPTHIRLECTLANEIKQKSDNFVKGFGSTDCSCDSHLFFFKKFPDLAIKN